MKTCAWIMEDESECGERCEGKTPFCGSHNRTLRREAETSRKQSEKRARQIKKAKEKSQQPRTKVKKVSERRAAESITYGLLRTNFLTQNPICQIKANEFCTKEATTIHHSAGRIGANYLDVSKWKGACMSCHIFVEAHPKEAIEKGWSMSRLSKEQPTI